MVFPNDIHKQMNDKRKIAGENAVQLFIGMFILLNIVSLALFSWLNTVFFHTGFWVIVIGVIALNVAVGSLVFRFVIFDENSKMREMKGTEGDSFAKYMKIRTEVERKLDTPRGAVNVTEFNNGSLAAVIEMRFGSNDDITAKNTAEMLQQMFSVAHANMLETRVCIMPENFLRSSEYARYSKEINSIPSLGLRTALILISEAILNRNRENSPVNCIYFTVRSSNNYQRAMLEDVLTNFVKIFGTRLTAFRSIRFLDNVELKEFFSEFYGVSAIDLSTTRAIEISKDLDDTFRQMIDVFAYEATDGTILKNQSVTNSFNTDSRDI